MDLSGITLAELLAENDASTAKWKAWFVANPAALDLPCDIYNSEKVRGLLKHVFAVELRHSQRLTDQEVVAYDAVPDGPLEVLFTVHAQAVENLRRFLSHADSTALGEVIALQTVSAGTVHASRRKLFVHVLLHSMRHWAQISTLLRAQGHKTEWPKDSLCANMSETGTPSTITVGRRRKSHLYEHQQTCQDCPSCGGVGRFAA